MLNLDTVPNSIPRGAALIDAILRLKREMNGVILAHYYQDDDIQDIADHVGDSLELARRAAATDAKVIVFCGVKFMAEGAKILNPGKLVLLPDMQAGCSLEDSCPPDEFKTFIDAHPGHMVVSYINCSAAVKALSDVIVTSSNAEKIIRQIPENQPIIFAPDRFLGGYLAKKLNRNMVLWHGSCMVHERFSESELVKLKVRYPNAHIIAHPECPEALLAHAEFIASTSGLIRYVGEKKQGQFLVLTEPGIFHAMQKAAPDAELIPVPGMEGGACMACNNCPHMKKNTLEKMYLCMRDKNPQLNLTSELLTTARKPLEKMLLMSA